MKSCIISVATGGYVNWQKRLIESANKFNQDIITWTDIFPPGSRSHHESLYGFKPWAFQYAFGLGYDAVLWLDSPCFLVQPLDVVWKEIEGNGYALIHGDDLLKNYMHERSINEFGPAGEDDRLLSGSFIGLHRDERILLPAWHYYEKEGWFMSAAEDASKTEPWRHDESILSLLAVTNDRKSVYYQESLFQNQQAPVLCRKD